MTLTVLAEIQIIAWGTRADMRKKLTTHSFSCKNRQGSAVPLLIKLLCFSIKKKQNKTKTSKNKSVFIDKPAMIEWRRFQSMLPKVGMFQCHPVMSEHDRIKKKLEAACSRLTPHLPRHSCSHLACCLLYSGINALCLVDSDCLLAVQGNPMASLKYSN